MLDHVETRHGLAVFSELSCLHSESLQGLLFFVDFLFSHKHVMHHLRGRFSSLIEVLSVLNGPVLANSLISHSLGEATKAITRPLAVSRFKNKSKKRTRETSFYGWTWCRTCICFDTGMSEITLDKKQCKTKLGSDQNRSENGHGSNVAYVT